MVEWCCMCKESGEFIDHLLIHCEVVRELWNSVLNLFGVEWVMSRRVIDLLVSWGGQVGHGTTMKVLGLILLCLMWSLAREECSEF